MSFGKRIQPYNYHSNQYSEHFNQLQHFPHAPPINPTSHKKTPLISITMYVNFASF